MSVNRCYICVDDPNAKRLYGLLGLEDGEVCPICYRPACSYHLTLVRWRWRESGEVSSARICKECKRVYNHRTWDAANRDWIS